MRIKISTVSPLSKNQCWFAISEKLEKKPIHQLTKKIVDQLNLSTEAANLKLSMDGFNLLPQTTIKDLLRDGDLVLIKEDQIQKPIASKKRKAPASSSEPEQDNELDTRPVKKTKKHKSSSIKNKVKEKKEKKDKEEKKEKKEKIVLTEKLEKKTKDKKKKNKETVQDTVDTKVSKQQSAPFAGLEKTKKRNMRRRALKQYHRMLRNESDTAAIITAPQLEQQPQQPVQVDAVHELQVEKLKITTNEPSEKLLKKNKNKKKNHLKGSKAENRSHVFYQQDDMKSKSDMAAIEKGDSNAMLHSNSSTVAMQQFDNDIAKNNDVNSGRRPNLYGRAFVTATESDPKYNGQRRPERYYPIHQVPTLFYAENPIEDTTSEPAPAEQITTTNENKATAIANQPVNYDNFAIADFESNIPAIGDQLAIKTLELTANYTPEISDWKQVILKELDLPNTATFEFVQGFGKTSTKGGKFDIKKHQKKRQNDWYQEEYSQNEEATEEQEDDLVNEDEQEQDMITVSIQDVFAMKNMSKQ